MADLERLAARLAMLASDDGEADNAGRAVGALARRIGLSGGDLKRIFLAGATGLEGRESQDRLRAELSELRQNFSMLDGERDALREENGRLKARLARLRANTRKWGLAGGALAVVALVVVGLVAWGSEPQPAAAPPAAQQVQGVRRAAIVRAGGALLFGVPDRAGMPLAALPAGERVQVRRLVWKELFQWAEVVAPGGWTGYVLTTDIDLS
jgi:hypothetical protein